MRCVNLHEYTIKILGIYYSYVKQLENEEDFEKYVAKIKNVLERQTSRLKGKLQF